VQQANRPRIADALPKFFFELLDTGVSPGPR